MTADDIDRAIATAIADFRYAHKLEPTHVFLTMDHEIILRERMLFRFSVRSNSTLDRALFMGMEIVWTVRDGPSVGILT